MLYGCRNVNTFDISQTEGRELPHSTVEMFEYGGEMEEELLQHWNNKIDIPFRIEDIGEAKTVTYYHLIEHYIAIHEKRSAKQQLKPLPRLLKLLLSHCNS